MWVGKREKWGFEVHFLINAETPSSITYTFAYLVPLSKVLRSLSLNLIYFDYFPLQCHLSQSATYSPFQILLLSFNSHCHPSAAYHFTCYLALFPEWINCLSLLWYHFVVSYVQFYYFSYVGKNLSIYFFLPLKLSRRLTCYVNKPVDKKKNFSVSELNLEFQNSLPFMDEETMSWKDWMTWWMATNSLVAKQVLELSCSSCCIFLGFLLNTHILIKLISCIVIIIKNQTFFLFYQQ